MSALLLKIRKAREKNLEVGGFSFTIRRPTDVEAQRLQGDNNVPELLGFVVGWDKVREIDVLANGDAHPLAFDAAVCREWLSDRPDLLQPLVTAIVEAYLAHRADLKEHEKN